MLDGLFRVWACDGWLAGWLAGLLASYLDTMHPLLVAARQASRQPACFGPTGQVFLTKHASLAPGEWGYDRQGRAADASRFLLRMLEGVT
ncbi:hypothetical protein E2C01_001330 [Portunus trituberculatus]|uniref:Uncharacterized protein n=1 Tax=Portunus trituberculatus TaxID=210409 RepID=A0A5B7CGW6_PORTR|nr:hypothetical protein [Portunus trituberculatus]